MDIFTAVTECIVKGGEHSSQYLQCQMGRTQQSLSTLSKGANTEVIVYTVEGGEHRSPLSKGANTAAIVYTVNGGDR